MYEKFWEFLTFVALILFSDSETASKLYDLHLNHALNRYEGHYMHLSLKEKCDGLSLVYMYMYIINNGKNYKGRQYKMYNERDKKELVSFFNINVHDFSYNQHFTLHDDQTYQLCVFFLIS